MAGLQLQSAGMENGKRRRRLQLEMALNKLAETGAYLELDRVADCEPSRGLQISAAKADGFYARKARGRALDLRTKRRVQRNTRVASRDNVTGARLRRRAKSGRCLLE